MSADIAVAYDYLQVVGGAELFSIELVRRLPQAQLVVSGIAQDFPKQLLPPNLIVLDPRPLPSAPVPRALHAMWAFRKHRHYIRSFQHLILSGHYSPLLYSTGQRGLYYAHTTPLPFLYEDRARVLADASFPKRLAHDMVARWLARQIRQALCSGISVIANSNFTATAIKNRLGIQAHVLFPPCDLKNFKPRPSQGYFLSFARQEPGKRVDRIIETFKQCPASKLVVASDGSQHCYLQALAAGYKNIEFVRTTDPQQIRALLSECRASIYVPLHEPFGISAVESLASGKPVIGVRSGGLSEIIEPSITGWLIDRDAEPSEFVKAIEHATEYRCQHLQKKCLEKAHNFGWDQFIEKFVGYLAA